jgi:hypothetical protein
MFGQKVNEVNGKWVVKSKRLCWTGHVLGWERSDMHTEFWMRICSESNHLEHCKEYGRVI